jgi:hypothetical protein
VAALFGRTKDADDTITLFHVTESLLDANLSADIPTSLAPAYQQVIDDARARLRTQGEELLTRDAEILHAAGIPNERTRTKLESSSARPESSKVAAALAIIDEMNKGDYEVVCVGRRGLASAEGAFPASMAEKIVRESRRRAVWIID